MFPSPTGDLYFSIRLSKTNIQYLFVSVPYRGLIFLNNATVGVAKDPKNVSVPYRGLIFLNLLPTVPPDKKILKKVSVPYRGLIFLNFTSLYSKRQFNVSVPYRGLIFLNWLCSIYCKDKFVSVPYRGLIFLNYHLRNSL